MGNGQSAQSNYDERAFTDERMGVPWGGERKLVISLDIGASHSAVVLAFLEPKSLPSIHRISHWPGQEAQSFDGKVPSLLLYDLSNENEPVMVAAGAEAKHFETKKNVHYYDARYFKLHIHSPDPKTHGIQSQELEGIPFPLTITTIYTDFIKYLLMHTKSRLQETTGQDLWAQYGATADVILTHPNRSNEAQKNNLRGAAIAAGLVSEGSALERLHFIDEAEAAARYCVSRYASSFGRLLPETKFLVCDAGGSTVDITTYKIEKSTKSGQIILTEQSSMCMSVGGIYLDTELKNRVLQRLRGLSEDSRREAANEAANDFEMQAKRSFGGASEACRIRVGPRNWSLEQPNITRGVLTFSGQDMEEIFQQASVSDILREMRVQLESKVNFIIVTGGFGESKYLKSQLQQNFGSDCDVIIPDDTSSLKPVAIGALMLVIGGGRVKVVTKKRSRFGALFRR